MPTTIPQSAPESCCLVAAISDADLAHVGNLVAGCQDQSSSSPSWHATRDVEIVLVDAWIHLLPALVQLQVAEHASSSLAAAYAAPITMIEYVAPSLACTCASTSSSDRACACRRLCRAYSSECLRGFITCRLCDSSRGEISEADGGGDAGLPAEVQPVVEAVVPESTVRDGEMGRLLACQRDAASRWKFHVVPRCLERAVCGGRGVTGCLCARVQALISLRLGRLEELPRRLGKHGSDPTG